MKIYTIWYHKIQEQGYKIPSKDYNIPLFKFRSRISYGYLVVIQLLASFQNHQLNFTIDDRSH